jgi:hypothetical protein
LSRVKGLIAHVESIYGMHLSFLISLLIVLGFSPTSEWRLGRRLGLLMIVLMRRHRKRRRKGGGVGHLICVHGCFGSAFLTPVIVHIVVSV